MDRADMIREICSLLRSLHRMEHRGWRYGSRCGVDVGLAFDVVARGLVWLEWQDRDGIVTERILGKACNERLPELLALLSAGEWPDMANWADEV